MKVVQLCHKPPYPCYDGGSMAMHSLSMGLAENGVELKLLSFATHKHPAPSLENKRDYKNLCSPDYIFIPAKTNVSTFCASLFSKWPFVFYRYYSKTFENKLLEVLSSQVDIVVFDGLYTTLYLDLVLKHSKAKCVYRAHNVEYFLWNKKYQNQRNIFIKTLLFYFAKQVYNFESHTLQKVHALAAISKTDQNILLSFNNKLPSEHIPFGFTPPEKNRVQIYRQVNQIGFVGALNWEPNVEALNWFLTEIWPIILVKNPHSNFHVAGRHTTSKIDFKAHANVKYWGEVDDIQDFYNAVNIIVVPLKSGSGVRIKIVEAMYQQKAVVSTTKGVEGLELLHGKHLSIANSSSEFANEIIELLSNEDKCARIALNGKIEVEKEYHYLNAGQKMLKFLNNLKA